MLVWWRHFHLFRNPQESCLVYHIDFCACHNCLPGIPRRRVVRLTSGQNHLWRFTSNIFWTCHYNRWLECFRCKWNHSLFTRPTLLSPLSLSATTTPSRKVSSTSTRASKLSSNHGATDDARMWRHHLNRNDGKEMPVCRCSLVVRSYCAEIRRLFQIVPVVIA